MSITREERMAKLQYLTQMETDIATFSKNVITEEERTSLQKNLKFLINSLINNEPINANNVDILNQTKHIYDVIQMRGEYRQELELNNVTHKFNEYMIQINHYQKLLLKQAELTQDRLKVFSRSHAKNNEIEMVTPEHVSSNTI